MAIYYPSSSNRRDILQTPYLRDPEYASYPEPPPLPGSTMMYLNQAASVGSYLEFSSRSSPSRHNHVEIPSLRGEGEATVYIPPTTDAISVQSISDQLNNARGDPISHSISGNPQMVPGKEEGILNGEQNLQFKGLALSLATQIQSLVPVPSSQYQYSNPSLPSFLSHHLPSSVEKAISCKGYESGRSDELGNAEYLPSGFSGGNHNAVRTEALCNPQCSVNLRQIHSDPYTYKVSGHADMICNSKYLKAAQQLLDEVVNVRQALKKPASDKHQISHGIGLDVPKETDTSSYLMPSSKNGMPSAENETNSTCEISPAEQQDLLNKKTRLLSMLDEVDTRYKQYYHQMQTVVSSFDMVAGSGAAKPYTALALQTISRHFRCFRDAISGQIQVMRQRLGDHDPSPNIEGGIPRLRYVDQQLRQQRVLQQFGVMRHAWRPQRGLPESSVSILRAWLFEHFLHPYPKDSEKIMLARQTGLTRGQVANWFINARVRLWKPMVEEMYKEEFGVSDVNSKSLPENAPKAPKDNSHSSEDKGEELQESLTSTAADGCYPGEFHVSKFDFIPEVELNGPTGTGDFQNGAHVVDRNCGMTKLKGGRSLCTDEFISTNLNGDGSSVPTAAAYPVSELGDFMVDSQVSLALGLRHCESDVLPMQKGQCSNFFCGA